MAEEEREGLSDVRKHLEVSRRHSLAVEFAVFEAVHVNGVSAVDRDPDDYVRQTVKQIVPA